MFSYTEIEKNNCKYESVIMRSACKGGRIDCVCDWMIMKKTNDNKKWQLIVSVIVRSGCEGEELIVRLIDNDWIYLMSDIGGREIIRDIEWY